MTDPTEVLARTLYGEARSGGRVAMQNVASAILNRAAHPRWWGTDVLSVCLHPWQFSCWNPRTVGAPATADYEHMIAATDADPSFAEAMQVARAAVGGTLADATHGADSYYAYGIGAPNWVVGARFTVTDGTGVFWITR